MVDEISFSSLRPIQPTDYSKALTSAGSSGGTSFKDILTDTLKQVDQLQAEASSAMRESFNPADPKALHEVMIALEEANIAFQFTLEVRNRLLEAYNEVMRMQV